jgi:hypothetical protein
VPPPSRGSWKAGAFAPSANADARGVDAAAFALEGFFVGAALAFDAAATFCTDSRGPDDFNGLEGALCEAPGVVFASFWFAFLPDFFAAAPRAFEGGVLADLTDPARVAFPEAALGDFLRVFLDIRLPFVAFGGSTSEPLRGLSRQAGLEPAAGQF